MSKGGGDEKSFDVQSVGVLWSKLNPKKPSLMKKHLTKDIYEKLNSKKTKLGGELRHCINSGVLNQDSGVGLYACDPEAYTEFGDLFDAVIKDYHNVDKVTHPKPNWGTESDIKKLDEGLKGEEMIVSTRVRVGRSHNGFSFPPTLDKKRRNDMEETTRKALTKLTGDLKGTYYPLGKMTKDEEKQLIEDHFLFKDDDRFLKDAGGYEDWPNGRGIFHNDKKTFLVWINEEDHLRFISMQQGGALGEVYGRLKRALEEMEKGDLKFAHDPNRGFLTFCPTNLGTAMRASVHIKIPHLQNNEAELNKICEEYKLQPRGIHGEHTESKGGVYDISNKERLGLTEWEAVSKMKKGILKIIEAEKKLAGAKK